MYSGCLLFFFFNDTATTEIYTLSLHDALPISSSEGVFENPCKGGAVPFSVWSIVCSVVLLLVSFVEQADRAKISPKTSALQPDQAVMLLISHPPILDAPDDSSNSRTRRFRCTRDVLSHNWLRRPCSSRPATRGA